MLVFSHVQLQPWAGRKWRSNFALIFVSAWLLACVAPTVSHAQLPVTQTFYVSNYGSSSIAAIAPNGPGSAGVVSTFVSGASVNTPDGIVFDSVGNLYTDTATVTSRGTVYSVVRIAPNGTVTTFFSSTSSATLNAPNGLAIDAGNNVYVANGGTNSIIKITPDGVGSVFAQGGTLNQPDGLAYSGGNLYVANLDSISRIDASGNISTYAQSAQFLTSPTSLAFDAAGNLFVTNYGQNTIARIDATLHTVSLFASGGTLKGPAGLGFDALGHLFVTNANNNSISILNALGQDSLYVTPDALLGTPANLAFAATAVPEPATSALVLLAVALLGGGAWRRRRRVLRN